MKETLEAIHQMQAEGVIGAYAIGGAVGATFYLDTEHLDAILNRHGLMEKWTRFGQRFLEGGA